MTAWPIFYILLSGMSLKSNILNSILRRALWLTFTLLLSIGFSTGGVLANSCQGNAGCLICAAMVHPRIPGMDMEMVNPVCQAAEQNSSCGFETDRRADDSDLMAMVAESGTRQYFSIFAAVFDESDQADPYRRVITQFKYPDTGEVTPIYLLNQSLLC